jgi:hypothetical protein
MRIARIATLSAVFMALFAAVGAVSASAHEFIAEPISVGRALNARSESNQIFTIGASGEPYVECTTTKLEGTVSEEKLVAQEVVVSYEKCTAHDAAMAVEATITPVKYDLGAEGTVTVQTAVEIKTAFGTQTVSSQSLSGISYENRPSEGGMPPGVLLTASVSGIKSTGVFGTSTTGMYLGKLLLLPVVGGLSWL